MLKNVLRTAAKSAFFTNSFKTMSNSNPSLAGTALANVITTLETFAPLKAAEEWDNVGLLIEPSKQRPISRILLTNDLTERVMEEAVAKQTDMIISYHPPIFASLKRITQSNWKERIVAKCLSENIAVYSPHTAWDAIDGGVNDWLASALPGVDVKPIKPNPLISERVGAGRYFRIAKEIMTLAEVIKCVQQHIGLDVHVAMAQEHHTDTPIGTVAVCAGSGASLLRDVTADLYLTGEMSHHELLDANHKGTSVLLCNHSNSERGFLKRFQPKLTQLLGGACEVCVSQQDADPLKTFVKQP